MLGPQLLYRIAARAGVNAVVRNADDRVLGWVVRGPDGLLHGRARGTEGRILEPGDMTVQAAMRRLVESLGEGD